MEHRQRNTRVAHYLFVFFAFITSFGFVSSPSAATKPDYLALAKKGWDYQYRSSAMGAARDIEPSHILARTMINRQICLVGTEPHPLVHRTLLDFLDLMSSIFDVETRPLERSATAENCSQNATILVRFYDTLVPHSGFNADLQTLNHRFEIGLSRRPHVIRSPAQAITFFGKKDQVTHIAVMTADDGPLTTLEQKFFRSLLIEELYQAFSFGIDIFHFETDVPLTSKLQETPTNLRHLTWDSPKYMSQLLESNPQGLCVFDIFMLHALAQFNSQDTSNMGFQDFIDARFEKLVSSAQHTVRQSAFRTLLDPACSDQLIQISGY